MSIDIDDNNDHILETLLGRTIVKIKRDRDTGEDWPDGANSVRITLDDGKSVEFIGYGYDASGCQTTIYTPGELDT